MSLPSHRLYTRRAGVKLIQEMRGFPLTKSRFDKDSMSKDGEPPKAPKPAAVYGRIHLYTEEQLLAYADNLITPARPGPEQDEARRIHRTGPCCDE